MKIGLINIALDLYKRNILKNVNSLVDMGSKELRVDFDTLKNSYEQTGINFDEKKFSILKKFPKGKRISTKNFWNDLGIKNYKCFDINNDHESIYFDLNYPFKEKKYINSFDLVADFGNNEHAFNVGEAYKTLYNLCKKNGLIWIFQAVYKGNGYFNFDKSFFEGYAAANNLSVVHSAYLINIDEYNQIAVPCDQKLYDVINKDKVFNVNISYIFKKNTNDKFQYYYQYNLDKKDEPYTITYLNNFSPAEKMYIPTKKINYYKKLAKKGDKTSIMWLRSIGIKF